MKTKLENEAIQIPSVLPMLPIRDLVVFPSTIIPLFVGREASVISVEESFANHERLIFLASQKEITDETPQPDAIYKIGTVAVIMRMRKIPDGRIKVLIQGISKAKILQFNKIVPHYEVSIEPYEEYPVDFMPEAEALMRNVREQLERVISLGKIFTPDILMMLDDVHDPGRLADLVASNLGLKVSDAQVILEIAHPMERLEKISEILLKEIEVLSLQAKIRSQAKDEMTRTQKEYFLREQMRVIKNELGDSDPKGEEIAELREKVMQAGMPPEAEQEALKQILRLERMHPDASEASMLRAYIDCLLEMPWNKQTQDNLDLVRAKAILDEDHHNLFKIKERVLEYLAVKKLKNKIKGPLLCFSGPPGVGKTSLGKSIAKALGRQFIRISLGGVKDEAEIRGHRRTYVGALPGRIVQGLKQAGTKNPIFVLDEIDKLGSDFRGDPSAALLEALDPEQNNSFRDHYLNLPFDLSNVMFIATCNQLDPIPAPLRDRMEIIQLSGYTENEKFGIAKKYLIPKQCAENGVQEHLMDVHDEAIWCVIQQYTKEAGLRGLERMIGSLCRKTARAIVEGKSEQTVIKKENVFKLLGPPLYIEDALLLKDEVGIATGLAWTAHGGEILYIEASVMPGKGVITLTGSLGDVMKESALAALGLIRSQSQAWNIKMEFFNDHDIHVHFPAGAIPKDGPSAGVAMATAILSKIINSPIRKDFAMTGEITLTGRVLPIGGLKEKSLAAMRSGSKNIIFPHGNLKDLEDIPAEYREKLIFHPVKSMDEIWKLVFTSHPEYKKIKGKVRKLAVSAQNVA